MSRAFRLRAGVGLNILALRVSPKIESVIVIDEALERLARIDPRQSRLVELRFFAGLSVEEAAEVMDPPQ